MTLQIDIHSLNGLRLSLSTEPTTKILEIKTYIESQVGLKIEKQLLYYNSHKLQDELTLQDYKMAVRSPYIKGIVDVQEEVDYLNKRANVFVIYVFDRSYIPSYI